MSLLTMTLAMAQEVPVTETAAPPEEAAARPGPDMLHLVEALELARQDAEANSERTAALEMLVQDAAVARDSREAPDVRAAALARMTERAMALELPEVALAMLVGAATDGDATVRQAGQSGLSELHAVDELVFVVNWGGRVGVEAMAHLEAVGTAEAGQALLLLANDTDLSRELSGLAREALERSFPELLEGNVVAASSSGGGLTTAALGNALVGGTVLSTVGVLGQTGAGVAIGVVGGGAIGGGSAVLYGLNNPVTTADGNRYLSSTVWGMTHGVLLGEAMLSNSGGRSYDNGTAMFRTLGVTAGAGQAYWAYKNDLTQLNNVWESNAAGALGTGTSVGLTLMIMDAQNSWSDEGVLLAASGGGLTGLALQAALRDRWNPGPADVGFALVVGTNGLWTSAFLPFALSANPQFEPEGRMLFGHQASTSLALLAAHHLEPTAKQDLTMAWGTVVGNSLGAGVPMLLDLDDRSEQPVVASMLVSGLVGSTAGYALGEGLEWTPGDRAMLAVGVPILSVQAVGYGGVLSARGTFDNGQMAGLGLVGLGASGLGLSVLSQRVDPTVGDMLVLGSGATWGAWYGVLTPVALRMDGRPEDLLLLTLVASDVGAVGAATLLYGLDVHPRATAAPQLGGLAGATLGSLGVGLVTGDGPAIAGGAVVGSVVGLAGGTLLEMSVLEPRRNAKTESVNRRPRVDLPGTWTAAAAPWTDEQGDLGVYATINWTEHEL